MMLPINHSMGMHDGAMRTLICDAISLNLNRLVDDMAFYKGPILYIISDKN